MDTEDPKYLVSKCTSGIARCEERLAQENRADLRIELALAHKSRGNAHMETDDIARALADFCRAIALFEELIAHEDHRELRNELARSYVWRGHAHWHLNHRESALADYNRTVTLYEELVEHEGRRELYNDLSGAYSSRCQVLLTLGDSAGAAADLDRGIGVLRTRLVEMPEQYIHLYILKLAFYCHDAQALDRVPQAAAHANEALHWLAMALETGTVDEILAPQAEYFLDTLASHADTLVPAGLDLALRDRVAESLKA